MSVRVLALLLGFKGQMVLAGIDDETAWHGMDGIGIGIGIGSWFGMGEQGGGVIFSQGFVFWAPRCWMNWLWISLWLLRGSATLRLFQNAVLALLLFCQSWTGVTLERIQSHLFVFFYFVRFFPIAPSKRYGYIPAVIGVLDST